MTKLVTALSITAPQASHFLHRQLASIKPIEFQLSILHIFHFLVAGTRSGHLTSTPTKAVCEKKKLKCSFQLSNHIIKRVL